MVIANFLQRNTQFVTLLKHGYGGRKNRDGVCGCCKINSCIELCTIKSHEIYMEL